MRDTTDRAMVAKLDCGRIEHPCMLLSPICLVPSGNGEHACRDLHTGTQLAAFKGNGSGSNCVCAVGRDYVAAAQMAKDSLHFWTWHKVFRATDMWLRELRSNHAAAHTGV